MKQSQDFTPEFAIPNWRMPTEARMEIRQTISEFLDEALISRSAPDQPQPALALAVSPGLGKTTAALRLLSERGHELLNHGHVLFYAPTLDLAEQAAAEFASHGSGLPYRILRGRDAKDPAGGTMCARSEFVKEISPLVHSVTGAVCKARKPDGEIAYAACAARCAYLRQFWIPEHSILFLPHAYLASPLAVPGNVSLRIIDEKIWPALTFTSGIHVDDWLSEPPPALGTQDRKAFRTIQATVLDALLRNRPIIATLKTGGIDRNMMGRLARHQADQTPALRLRPWENRDAQSERARGFDRAGHRVAKRRARILAHLEAKFDRCDTERLSLRKDDDGGTGRLMIRLHSHVGIPDDSATLFLDADVNPAILERLRPAARVVSIVSRPQAEILQTTDSTLANSALLHPDTGTRKRAMILDVIRAETARAAGRGVLVVATKPVLRALHRDAASPGAAGTDPELLQPLLGATPRWFGPRLLGVNDYKTFATVILIGRLQVPVPAVEDTMRGLFGDEAGFLEFARDGRFQAGHGVRLMQDSGVQPARLWTHPDPRGAAILAQTRECASLQAIARLRLIAPDGQKRVVILGNMPLPGLPVSRTTTLAALADGLDAEPDVSGYRRLTAALGQDRDPAVPGVRLSPAGLHQDLPGGFRTPDSAKEFRRGRDTDAMVALMQRIARANGWPVTVLRLRRPGAGGNPVPAVVFADKDQAVLRVRHLWPDLSVTCSNSLGTEQDDRDRENFIDMAEQPSDCGLQSGKMRFHLLPTH